MPVARGDQPGFGVVVESATVDSGRFVLPPSGVYQPYWIAPDADGTILDLNPAEEQNGAERFSLRGIGGLGAALVDLSTSASILGGVTVDGSRVKERTLNWPLRIRARTHLEFVAEWRRVVKLFTMTRRRGPGRLRIERPDGTRREILAYYTDGMEGQPDEGAWRRETMVVQLLCPEGLWRDVDPVQFEQLQETGGDYLNPYPSIGSGTVIGAGRWANLGDDDAWPIWTVRGPMTAMTATNVTRGQSFTVTYTLGVGETLTVQSQPIKLRGPAGQNIITALNLLGGGKPWRLDADAETDVTFSVSGAAGETAPGANNGTKISAEFWQMWETA